LDAPGFLNATFILLHNFRDNAKSTNPWTARHAQVKLEFVISDAGLAPDSRIPCNQNDVATAGE
jgi:hypothetical protein